MKTPSTSRQFAELIHKVSSMWPNWDPGSDIYVGDYGTINNETGALDVEGNIYKGGVQSLGINLSDKSSQPQKAPVGADMIITSPSVEYSPGKIPRHWATLTQANFQFKKGERGAVLIMRKPQQEFIPLDNVLNIITKATKLHGKYLVTSTFRCPGCYIYLSSMTGENILVALTNSGELLSHIPDKSMQWWTDGRANGAPYPRQGYVTDDQRRFTPLYTLEHIQNNADENDKPQGSRGKEEEETEYTVLLMKTESKPEKSN